MDQDAYFQAELLNERKKLDSLKAHLSVQKIIVKALEDKIASRKIASLVYLPVQRATAKEI